MARSDARGRRVVRPASPDSGLFGANLLPSAPEWTPVTVIENGGTETSRIGGTVSELHRVRSSGATAQRTTVGDTSTSERGVAPGVYHLEFESLDNAPCTVVYELRFEERTGRG